MDPNSSDTANLIDNEVKRFIEEAYVKAKSILQEHLDKLHNLAAALLEYETLTGEEIKQLLEGQAVQRSKPNEAPKIRKSSLPSTKVASGEA